MSRLKRAVAPVPPAAVQKSPVRSRSPTRFRNAEVQQLLHEIDSDIPPLPYIGGALVLAEKPLISSWPSTASPPPVSVAPQALVPPSVVASRSPLSTPAAAPPRARLPAQLLTFARQQEHVLSRMVNPDVESTIVTQFHILDECCTRLGKHFLAYSEVYAAMQASVRRLNDAFGRLCTELDEARRQVQSSRDEAEAARRLSAAHHDSVKTELLSLQEATEKIRNRDENLRVTASQNQDLFDQLNKMKRRMAEAEEISQHMQSRNVVLQVNCGRLEHDVQRLTAALESSTANHDADRRLLEGKQRTIESLEDKVASLNSRLEQLDATHHRTQNELRNMVEVNRTITQTYQKLQNSFQDAQAKQEQQKQLAAQSSFGSGGGTSGLASPLRAAAGRSFRDLVGNATRNRQTQESSSLIAGSGSSVGVVTGGGSATPRPDWLQVSKLLGGESATGSAATAATAATALQTQVDAASSTKAKVQVLLETIATLRQKLKGAELNFAALRLQRPTSGGSSHNRSRGDGFLLTYFSDFRAELARLLAGKLHPYLHQNKQQAQRNPPPPPAQSGAGKQSFRRQSAATVAITAPLSSAPPAEEVFLPTAHPLDGSLSEGSGGRAGGLTTLPPPRPFLSLPSAEVPRMALPTGTRFTAICFALLEDAMPRMFDDAAGPLALASPASGGGASTRGGGMFRRISFADSIASEEQLSPTNLPSPSAASSSHSGYALTGVATVLLPAAFRDGPAGAAALQTPSFYDALVQCFDAAIASAGRDSSGMEADVHRVGAGEPQRRSSYPVTSANDNSSNNIAIVSRTEIAFRSFVRSCQDVEEKDGYAKLMLLMLSSMLPPDTFVVFRKGLEAMRTIHGKQDAQGIGICSPLQFVLGVKAVWPFVSGDDLEIIERVVQPAATVVGTGAVESVPSAAASGNEAAGDSGNNDDGPQTLVETESVVVPCEFSEESAPPGAGQVLPPGASDGSNTSDVGLGATRASPLPPHPAASPAAKPQNVPLFPRASVGAAAASGGVAPLKRVPYLQVLGDPAHPAHQFMLLSFMSNVLDAQETLAAAFQNLLDAASDEIAPVSSIVSSIQRWDPKREKEECRRYVFGSLLKMEPGETLPMTTRVDLKGLLSAVSSSVVLRSSPNPTCKFSPWSLPRSRVIVVETKELEPPQPAASLQQQVSLTRKVSLSGGGGGPAAARRRSSTVNLKS